MSGCYPLNVSFCSCDCHKPWFSVVPPVCNCKCWTTSVTVPCISETLSLCQHGMPMKFGNCVKCAEEHKNNLMNSQHEHLIEHAQDGIEKCFERIEKLEELAHERAHLINYKSYLDLADRLEKLEDNIKDAKVYSNPLQEKVWQENIIKRLEALESYKFTQALDPQVWVHVNERLDKLESLLDFQKIEILIFEGAKTHASILKCEAKLKELEKHTNNRDENDFGKNTHYLNEFDSIKNQLKALTEMYKEVSLKHVKLIDVEMNKKHCSYCGNKND